jgi:hypothetical protein
MDGFEVFAFGSRTHSHGSWRGSLPVT